MRILSFSRLGLVVSLILGLFVAWSATGPQRISGNQIVAGADCNKCDGDHNVHCSPIDPEKPCTAVHINCYGEGGMDCLPTNLSCFGTNCKIAWDHACL